MQGTDPGIAHRAVASMDLHAAEAMGINGQKTRDLQGVQPGVAFLDSHAGHDGVSR